MDKFLNYVDIEMAYKMVERATLFQLNNPRSGWKNIFIHGKPALGKSQIIREIAEKHGFEFIDVRLSGADETMVMGLPYVWDGEQLYSTPSWWPTGDKPSILCLEELKNAPMQTQVAAYRLILDRSIQNGKVLPDNCVIIATGNMQSDKTGARELTTTVASRFCMHLIIDPATTNRTFLNYAVQRGLNRHMIGYLEWRKENTYVENSDEAPTALPRTWEFLSNNMLMYDLSEYDSTEFRTMVAAAVGTTVGTDFVAYLANVDKLPDWTKVRTDDPNYDYVMPKNEPAVHFGVSTGLAMEMIENLNKNGTVLTGYEKILDDLPREMHIVFFRTLRRNMATAVRVLQSKEFSGHWGRIKDRVK